MPRGSFGVEVCSGKDWFEAGDPHHTFIASNLVGMRPY
jgi:hypothetical protein